jgi:hypothetical protein
MTTNNTGRTRSRTRTVILVVAGALLAIFVFVNNRLQIQAKLWHWRHGNSVDVGNFRVPVPEPWLVRNVQDRNSILMIDTRKSRGPDPLSDVNAISVFLEEPSVDLDYWANDWQQWLRGRGSKEIELRNVNALADKIVCVGGHEFRDVMRIPGTSVVSLFCRSTAGLSLTFVGSERDKEEFYTIISNIQKRH